MSRVVFTLQDLDQATAPRHLRQGSLTVSQNTRATKTGPRRKRRGFARTVVSSYTFPVAADDTDSSPAATMQELSPGGVMFRDASDNIWARRSDGGQAWFRGEHRRPGVTVRHTAFAEHKTIKPMSIADSSGNVWTFALTAGTVGAVPTTQPSYESITWTIENSDGTVIAAPRTRVDGTGNSIANYVAVYHPVASKMYVFVVYRNTVINIFSLSGSPGNLGAVLDDTTYLTTATAKWNCVDAIYDTQRNRVVVAASSWNEGAANTIRVHHGVLDTATNAEAASPTPGDAELSDPGTTGVYLCSGVSFLQGQPFTDTKVRYVYWTKTSTNQDSIAVKQEVLNASTLAEVDKRALISLGATRYTLEHAGVCCGYYDSGTDESMVFAELMYPAIADEETTNPTGDGNSFNALTMRAKLNNTTLALTALTGTSAPGQGAWLASKPFQGADSKWYVLMGVDSGTNGYQRAFHVRRADVGMSRLNPDGARIVAQIFWPTASFRGHRWRGQIPASPETITNAWGWAPTCAAITGGCKIALGQTGETPQSHAIDVVTIDFTASFSRGIQLYDDLILYPGGVPVVAGPRTPAHDFVPLVFPVRPPRVSAAGSSSALGPVLVTTSFRFRDHSGRITRSTSYPDPASLVFNSSGTRTLAVRTCQHIGHGEVEIEIWSTIPGGTTLHLQAVVPNDPSAKEMAVAVDPANFREDTETLPAAAQGALVPTPVPPCRLVAIYGDRVIVSGTPTEGEFLFSQTLEPGFGPLFNIEGLAQTWTGQGPINAMGAVDLNTFGFFRRAQVGAIQGPGPPDTGGVYGPILEINTSKGVSPSATHGGLVFQTPFGIVFQDAASGRLCVLEPGLRVEELPPGAEDTAIFSKLVAGGLVESEGTCWFMNHTGGISVIDLRHPDQGAASRWGNWHIWTSSALTASASVGLVDTADGPLWLQADGSWRTYKTSGQLFQDTNAAGSQVDVLISLTTGLMAPDGHHGEVIVSDLQVLGTYLSASSVRVTTTDDAGSSENHDVTLSSPFNHSWRPGNLLRVQEFSLTIAEQAGSTGEGFELDSVGVEFEAAGRMKRLATGRVI
jgi:hypothetical protein